MKRIAALDLGTNSFLCLIADVGEQGALSVVSDRSTVVRLGQGVGASRRFHPEALARADECLADYAAEIKKRGVQKIVAAATSAARDVVNGDELLALGRKHGIEIEIISGDREAECTFFGTVGSDATSPVAIIDVGGGSTEFIVGDSGGIRGKVSIDVGAVRMTEACFSSHPVPERQIAALETKVREALEPVRALFSQEAARRLIAVAGTPTTVAAIELAKPFDASLIDGFRLSTNRLRYWAETLAAMDISTRQKLPGMEPKRAEVLVAGTLILMLGCEALGFDEMEVSVRGLRYGLAAFAGRVS